MRNFLKGKQLWGYVSRNCVKPKSTNENYAAELNMWEEKIQKLLLGLTILLIIQ